MKKNFSRFALMACTLLVAGFASAEVDTSISGIINNTQETITDIVAAVLLAGGVILGAMVGLRALPWAYRKIVGFFK